jgi:hypothetical protein
MLNGVILPVVQQTNPDAWQVLVMLTRGLFIFPKDNERQAEAFIEGFRKVSQPADRMAPALGRELSADDLRVAQSFFDVANSGLFPLGGCSSFSVWGGLADGGVTITGRNSDWRTFPGRFPLMLVAQQPAEAGRQATIEISGPGVFGASTAMNEQGVVVAMHDERGLPAAKAPSGFWPRILALRQALEGARAATAVEDVAEALRGKAPMMGCNVHVSMPVRKGATGTLPSVIEWDGNPLSEGVTVRGPRGSAACGSVACTNHYLKRREPAAGPGGNSEERLRLLSDAIAAAETAKTPIDLSKAKAMMDSVARSGGATTYLSVIAFPDSRKMVVALTPKTGVSATRGHWVEVDWQQVFAAK